MTRTRLPSMRRSSRSSPDPGSAAGDVDRHLGPERGAYLTASGEATLRDTEATSEDNFRIGSITKTVTAAAVLAEVDGGDLALDAVFTALYPELKEWLVEVGDGVLAGSTGGLVGPPPPSGSAPSGSSSMIHDITPAEREGFEPPDP
jgi:CubicO group peptidase (beta-lactamase class C family)